MNMSQKRRLLLTALALLVVNYLASFVGFIALLLWLFESNWLMALAPSLVAAIFILLQPWALAFIFLPQVAMIAPIFTTILTLLIYGWLDRRGWFDRLKPILQRWGWRGMLKGSAIALSAGLATTYAGYKDFPSLRSKIPIPNFDHGQLSQIRPLQSQSYQLSVLFGSEALWKAKLTPQDFAKIQASLQTELSLQKLPSTALPPQFFHQAPYWWQPQVTTESEIYGNPDFFSTNRDGSFGMLLWNPKTQIVYVWYYSRW
jgi:hypothetical protein